MKKVFILFLLFLSAFGFSQVTKSSISGTVKSSKGELLPGATIEVVHQPTGTKYFANADFSGNYAIPAIRPGGPYLVKISFMGMKTAEITDINAPLGNNVNVSVVLQDELNALQEVVVAIKKPNSAFSKGRTGASQQFSTREINAVPVLGSRSISAITKYNANAGANGSFGGQDSRMNNFTIDGSAFNDGFGLGSTAQAGGRTGSTAISLDAIEQVQVNIAPFDVRQSGFTGTGINAVTRSGTNDIEGSVYHSFRNNKKEFIGTKAGKVAIEPAAFDEKIYGVRFGAPIIKNKLFFFGNFETVDNTSPATNWTTSDSPLKGSQVSAPTTAQMQTLSSFLQDKFNYTTGPWENYDAVKESKKFLARLDWNINDNHKLTVRYIHHDSNADQGVSGSNSLGFGNRTGNQFSMAYKNSGYIIKDNSRSIVVELDSKLSNKWNNNFIGGFDYQNEDRDLQGGGFFPTIDIKNGVPNALPLTGYTTSNNSFISAGLDPFTQGNLLSYSTLHFTDNLTRHSGNHTFVLGANFEHFKSDNSFFPGSNGVYVFNSLDEFYLAANESLASGGAPSTANLPIRTQFRYSALPGGADPLQTLKSNKLDLYAQDEIKVYDNLRVTLGLRATRVSFEDTALENPKVTAMTFANGEKFNTGEMPKTQYLFEPRLGFNLDVTGDAKTQVRGGTGIFSGRPPMVFLSNAIGNNGILTGLVDVSGDALIAGGYGFTSNPAQYFTPATPTLPSTLDLNFTDRNFKFPQAWKTTIALDQKLPFGFVGTIEGIFSKNINEVFYYNANLAAPVGTINGSASGDYRPLYAGTDNGLRINNNVINGIVLSNTNQGYFYSTTFKLDYPYKNGLWGSVSYTHSKAEDLMSAGSTAAATFSSIRSVNGNNNASLSASNNNTPHRVVGIIGYKIEYGKTLGAATSINLGYIGEQSGPFSYTYSGNLNGDGLSGNDLLYVPNKASDLRFVDITQNVGGQSLTLYSAAQQEAAFDAFIDQDPYLSTKRGQYVDRNSNVLPMLHRLDLSVTQDVYIKIAGKKNSFQFRADILNFTNLLNRDWGVSQRATATNILAVSQAPSSGNNYIPGYQMALQTDEQGKRFLAKDSFQKNSSIADVWQAQFTIRYTFGK
ncbi:MAG: carboxypeptidase regulatory-like domain-containing protein [Flavobacterium sp.]|uniref:TonB-dependent receptor n=1 Tax=Flavobacterium sp. TaxID=239 RepID=UPI00326673AA